MKNIDIKRFNRDEWKNEIEKNGDFIVECIIVRNISPKFIPKELIDDNIRSKVIDNILLIYPLYKNDRYSIDSKILNMIHSILHSITTGIDINFYMKYKDIINYRDINYIDYDEWNRRTDILFNKLSKTTFSQEHERYNRKQNINRIEKVKIDNDIKLLREYIGRIPIDILKNNENICSKLREYIRNYKIVIGYTNYNKMFYIFR